MSAKLDQFARAYIEAALWSSCADVELQEYPNGDRSYSDLGMDHTNLAPETLAAMIAECKRFREVAGALLDSWPDDSAGHDFWLTRNGHGAGFWDRDPDTYPNGRAISDLVGWRTEFPERDLYSGDDGLIYQS